jgi:hypothetical protein
MQDYSDIVREYIDDKFTVNQNPPLLPQHPFRLILCGSAGSGKSTTLLNLLFGCSLGKLNYTRVYWYAPDLYEDKTEYAIRRLRSDLEGKDGKPQIFYGSSISEIPSPEELDENYQNIIIVDDFICEDNRPLENLFIRSRKKNCSLIYLTQSYYKTDPILRLNATYVALFRH